jgi:hypothetical protein
MTVTVTNGYCTLAELQSKLGRTVTASDPNADALNTCINNASRFIDEQTGSFFYDKTLTAEVVDIFGMSTNQLVVSEDQTTIRFPAPVISISSLSEDGTTLTENEDFYIYGSEIQRDGYWSSERRAIQITGHIGYSSTPSRAQMWCLSIAAALSGLDASAFTDEDGSTMEVIRRNTPKWILDQLRMERRLI